MKRLTATTLAVVLTLILGVIVPIQTATAAPWDGRYFSNNPRGSNSYFDNKRYFTLSHYNAGLLNYVLSAGLHVSSPGEMVNYLRAMNRGPSSSLSQKRDVAGSAFIVQTILGRSGDVANANGGRNISDADFNTLLSTLNAASINWNTTVCTNGINTMSGASSSKGQVDIMRDPDKIGTQHCEDGISISDTSGHQYNIFHRCANPVGDTQGIDNIKFNLTPSISTNPSNAVTAGGTATATGVVNNTGPTPSTAVEWQESQFTVPSGNPPSGGTSNQDPKGFFGRDTTAIDSGTRTFPIGLTSFPKAVTVPDLPVGTKICFVMSVRPYNQSTGDWYHSNPSCVVIAKRPTAQIVGGDLRVGAAFVGSTVPVAGSNIQTSVTIKTGKSYGTWGEYGLIASGIITGAASGSAYSGGLACTTGCAINTISFTNSSGTIGKYTAATNIPDVASSFSISASTPQFSSLADAASQRVETSNNDITINGGTIRKGQWLVINAPTKTVTITGDIKYDNSPLQAITDIPQLVIIADKINIEGNVGQVDAWLVASGATGSVNTCSASNGTQLGVTDKLTSSMCNNTLVINGPVMAKTLYLRRTAGADNAAQTSIPAEVINLRPDAFLWATSQSSKSARLDTTYVQDLPPRF